MVRLRAQQAERSGRVLHGVLHLRGAERGVRLFRIGRCRRVACNGRHRAGRHCGAPARERRPNQRRGPGLHASATSSLSSRVLRRAADVHVTFACFAGRPERSGAPAETMCAVIPRHERVPRFADSGPESAAAAVPGPAGSSAARPGRAFSPSALRLRTSSPCQLLLFHYDPRYLVAMLARSSGIAVANLARTSLVATVCITRIAPSPPSFRAAGGRRRKNRGDPY